MDLKQYIAENSQASLANLIGVAPSFVNQWVSGSRPVPIPTCVQIEQATSGRVRRWDLRPADWHRIWPELIDAEGAPPVPELAKV